MTDMYEQNEHETGHDEVLTPEQKEVREAPSDYEFADEHSATAEHSVEHDAAAGEVSPKGRSAVLPIIAAVGGVLLLGAVAWWQFGGGNSAPQPDASPKVADTTVQTFGGDDAAASAPVAPKTAAAAAAPIPAPPPAPIAAAPAPTPSAPAAPTAPAPIAMAPDATPAPVAATPAPVAPAPLAPAPATPVATTPTAVVPPVAMPTPAPIAAAPVPAPTGGSDEQRIDALSMHIDDLQKSLDQVTQQLSQINSAVAAGAPAANAASTKELQDRIDHLEQELAQVRHKAPALAAPVAIPGEDAAPMAAALSLHHVSHKKPHVVAKHIIKPVAKPPVESVKWVLRAATPDQAWVASSATSKDLKPLRVGDTLDGVGRVTAIEQDNGNWVVKGSKGMIQ